MSDRLTDASNDQLAAGSSHSDQLAEVSSELETLQFGKGHTTGTTAYVYVLALQFCSALISVIRTVVDNVY